MAHAAQEPHQGEEVGGDPGGAELDRPVPEGVHHVVGEGTSVFTVVLVSVKALQLKSINL